MLEYMLYKGDKFIALGTVQEISQITKIKESTLRFYSSPSYKKRLADKGQGKNAKIMIRISKGERTKTMESKDERIEPQDFFQQNCQLVEKYEAIRSAAKRFKKNYIEIEPIYNLWRKEFMQN